MSDFETKVKNIQALIDQAEELLEEARDLSDGLEDEGAMQSWKRFPSFRINGPTYGMGGSLQNGEWFASSEQC
ncbi:hypothetical protein [Xanthomonas phage BUDD]|nr:hypothetical protein [Xanthomonas phage BUDD]